MEHLLPNALKEFRYYERKLPLYLRNDECFIEHFYLWYELCCGKGDETINVPIDEFCGVAPSSDLLLYLLNIYDADFLTTLQQLDGYDGRSDILDKIGAIFGLRRQFAIDYYETPIDTETIHAQLDLQDNEFLLLIKAQIIRNYCDGSYAQAMEYYADAGLEILPVDSQMYDVTVDCYINDAAGYNQDIIRLFKAGYLTIEHLGIRYTYYEASILSILLWAPNVEEPDKSVYHVWADEDGTITNAGVFIV